MTQTLYFDFETVDPELLDRGSCYIWSPEFKVLGMAYAIDDGPAVYTQDYDEMRRVINDSLILVAHNATYEIGCCNWLNMQGGQQVDLTYKPIFCTRIGSKLQNNLRRSHSLKFLGKSLAKNDKDQDRFGRLVLNYTMEDGSKFIEFPKKYQRFVQDLTQYNDNLIVMDDEQVKESEEYIAKTYPKYLRKATTWAMQNLETVSALWPEVVEEYAKNDVEITRIIHKIFLRDVDKFVYSAFSDLSKITVAMRRQGVRLDLQAAREAWNELDDIVTELQRHRN
jgi:hypothetical protein